MTKQYKNKVKQMMGIGQESLREAYGSYSVADAVNEYSQDGVLDKPLLNSLGDRQQDNSKRNHLFDPVASQTPLEKFCSRCIWYNWNVCRECKYE